MSFKFTILPCSSKLVQATREQSQVLLGNNPNNYKLNYRDTLDAPLVKAVSQSLHVDKLGVYGCCSGHGQRSAYIIFITEPKDAHILFGLAGDLHMYKAEICHVAPLMCVDAHVRSSEGIPFIYDTDYRVAGLRFKADNVKANKTFFADIEEAILNQVAYCTVSKR